MHREKRDKTRRLWHKKLHCIGSHRISLLLMLFFCLTFILSATVLVLYYVQVAQENKALRELASSMPVNITDEDTFSVATTAPLQSHQSPIILAQYRELYRQNAEMVGWIRIDGTRVNYPVMYTANDFYLSHGFDKAESKSGVPFVDKRCAVDPFGTNTIIYGHNMKNGTMFADLLKYVDEEYFTEHPLIQFDTLYEQQKFEIIAVFKSQTFRKSDRVFKHYDFLRADNAAVFDEYIANIKSIALYDTGVTASYGDKLLTLVTCSYHAENGRLVVVARKHSIEQPE